MRLSTVVLLVLGLHTPTFQGLFVGGTDFLVDYQHSNAFNVSKIQAHSVNLGASFGFSDRCGVDVLPIILGTTGEQPTYAASLFWRCYLYVPGRP